MNKRIYFILLPILAIIFSIICGKNNAVSFNEPSHDLRITKNVVQVDFPYSPGVKKENNNRIKNAIRIKALHDVVAIDISSILDPIFICLLSPRVIYGGYRLYELSAHFSTSGLRGPPAA